MDDYTKLVEDLRDIEKTMFALGTSPINTDKISMHYAYDKRWGRTAADAADVIEALQAQLPKRGEWIRVNKSDESQRMELYIANHQIPDDESEKSRLIKYLFNIYIESERASQLGIFERSEHEVD